jgi:orotidine-5'-phosphate decarboxylase
MTLTELLGQIRQKESFLCIGLDPDPAKFPSHFGKDAESAYHFLKSIIEATHDLCVAYKPNLAFFEAFGSEGWALFEKVLAAIPDGQLVIADAKRGDIGNTSKKYATAFFDHHHCDALTIAPYMGSDSVLPFLGNKEKWVVLLGLTSNPGSEDFQMQKLENGRYLYEEVLHTAKGWGTPEELMFVIGATHPESFQNIRSILPDYFFLVPGVGAQGGSLAEVCEYGMNDQVGLLVNSSRGILYAGNDEHFAESARDKALELQQEMSVILQGVNK